MKMRIIKLMAGSQTSRNIANSLIKAVNGNIKGMKITCWNKTNAPLMTKINDIKEILKNDKPHVLIVNELNLNEDQHKGITNYQNYKFESDKLLHSIGKARTGMWIHKDIIYSRNFKLEDNVNSVVAVKIGFPHKKKINLIGYYRQFRYVGKSRNIKREIKDLDNVTKKIAELCDKKEEVLLMGDINVDMDAVNKINSEKTTTQKCQNKLMNILKSNLIDKGINLLNDKHTFRRTDYSSQLDVIFSNRPQKINNISQNDELDSDHSSITCTRNININSAEERLILVRNFKNIDPVNLNLQILTHEKYQPTLISSNANEICENTITILNDVFNSLAPEKRIKIHKNSQKIKPNKLLKEVTDMKNEAYKKMIK